MPALLYPPGYLNNRSAGLLVCAVRCSRNLAEGALYCLKGVGFVKLLMHGAQLGLHSVRCAGLVVRGGLGELAARLVAA